ncbi:MAG TPA: hypothetical protein H9751_00370 [Candidatus Corynebacterium faecigallinarum]|uniref:Uncharacterized protein n=1 Tax=Candidatus Corynebacterium faecigallinarum TaxID=2838528 RepID=A0A9D2QAM8_9CORY|nr:hypothetical protein [Candidatus Corynebacterium faecigallinarum]
MDPIRYRQPVPGAAGPAGRTSDAFASTTASISSTTSTTSPLAKRRSAPLMGSCSRWLNTQVGWG